MIRRLEEKDACKMLEWMHDDDVVFFLDANFKYKTIDDCYCFIRNSFCDNINKHFAIVDDNNEYMGTVSIKNINYEKKIAEMAIVLRKCAMGKGYSKKALEEIFEYGSKQLEINTFYWYVNPLNIRAIKFYDKNGYTRVFSIEGMPKLDNKYIWYKHCVAL